MKYHGAKVAGYVKLEKGDLLSSERVSGGLYEGSLEYVGGGGERRYPKGLSSGCWMWSLVELRVDTGGNFAFLEDKLFCNVCEALTRHYLPLEGYEDFNSTNERCILREIKTEKWDSPFRCTSCGNGQTVGKKKIYYYQGAKGGLCEVRYNGLGWVTTGSDLGFASLRG